MNAPAFTRQSRVGNEPTAKVKAAPRYWTEQEEARLAHLREVEGLSPAAIGAILNRTKQSVSAKIERMGLELPENWKPSYGTTLTANQLAAVRRFWMRGDTVQTCAARLGLYEPRVARAYRQLSIEEQERPALPPQVGTYIGAKEMMLIVAPILGIRPSGITGPSRLKPFVCAKVAIAQALKDRGLSAGKIAHLLGRDDHTTALHWFKLFEPYKTVYPETLRAYEAIKRAERMAAERLAA